MNQANHLAEELSFIQHHLQQHIDTCKVTLHRYAASGNAKGEITRARQQHLELLERIMRFIVLIHRLIPMAVLNGLAGLIELLHQDKQLTGGYLCIKRNETGDFHKNPCQETVYLEEN
jgi:hypothetical protein